MKGRGLTIISFLLLLMVVEPEVATAQETKESWWRNYLRGSSLTLGIGGRAMQLKAIRQEDDAEGTITQRDNDAWFLVFSTRPRYFGDSHVGYTYMWNISTFHMDQQKLSEDEYLDMGTDIRGYALYFVPTIFRIWGDHYNGRFFRVGMGLGLGYADAAGDMYLTKNTPDTRISVERRGDGLLPALSVLVEGRWNHWGIMVTSAGPSFDSKNYHYEVSDVAVNVGYTYYLPDIW